MKLIRFEVSDEEYGDIRKYCFIYNITIRKFFTVGLGEKLKRPLCPKFNDAGEEVEE